MAVSKQFPWKKTILVSVVVALAGVGAGTVFSYGVSFTESTEFCTSCHSMQTNLEEYEDSYHFLNASGVRAGCSDCHVPKDFFPKMRAKLIATKDIYHEIMGTIDTPEKFEARRWHLANRVWDRMERSNSRECHSCHTFTAMDLTEQGRSARSRHAKAEDKGMTCIDCHKGVAHYLPDEPDDE